MERLRRNEKKRKVIELPYGEITKKKHKQTQLAATANNVNWLDVDVQC